MKTMISGIVQGRSLGPAAAVAALLSVAAFAGAAPARRAGRHQYVQFGAWLRRHAVRQGARCDRLPRAGADRRSASHTICRRRKWRSAIRPGPRTPTSSTNAARPWIRAGPRRKSTPIRASKCLRRSCSKGAGPLPTEGPPDECQAGAGTPICLYAPWKALKSMVSGASVGYDPAGAGAAAQISDRAAARLQKGDRGRQGNHRSAEGST